MSLVATRIASVRREPIHTLESPLRILNRVLAIVSLATLIAFVGVPAAWAELRTESEITYTANVDEGSLDLESRLVLTNLTPDVREGDTITRFFYREIRITVPVTVENFRASSGGQQLSHTLRPGGDENEGLFLSAVVDLGRQLAYQETMEILLEYEIPGDPPRSETTFRINPAYIDFAVFGWGDPGLVTVNVVTPNDFAIEFTDSEWDDIRSVEGSTIHTVASIDELEDFVIRVKGYNDSALVRELREVGGAQILIGAWPGDSEWSALVSDTVASGLPVLIENIGLPWRLEDPLPVNESADVALAGYGGWYIQGEQLVELSEWAEPHVVLHELSHVWFNQDLFRGRWINEGLAEVYSRRAAVDAGLAEAGELRLDMGPIDTVEVGPLNTWVIPDRARLDTEQIRASEEYGYDASQWVVQELTDEIGFEAMSGIFTAADRDLIAYRGAPPPERVDPADDWRRLLDLLEELGDSAVARDLFTRYITDEKLTFRYETRGEYSHLVDEGRGWLPPFYVREPMSTWDFEMATSRIAEARNVLDTRFQVEENLVRLGLTPAGTLEDAYESATDTLGDVQSLADGLVETTDTVVEAAGVVDADRNFLMEVGLFGSDLEAEYQEALDRLEAEDLDAAAVEAEEVILMIQEAERAGQLRLGMAAGALVLVAGTTTMVLVRRRRDLAFHSDQP